MFGFERATASTPCRQELAHIPASLHIAAWIVFALMLAGLALAPSHAMAACPGPCSKEQLATGLANPPSWAKGRKIHFAPESPEASAYSPSLLEAEDEPLLFHEGGQVQHAPKIYVIYWGSNFTTTTTGIEDRAMLQKFFTGLTGSAYQGIMTQYFDATGRISSTVSTVSYVDEKVKAPEKVTPVMIEEEVASAVSANKWTPETSAQFFVTTAPGSTYEPVFTGCGYHSVTPKVPGGAVYSWVPYQGDPPFSTKGCLDSGGPSKNPILATSSVVSHEYAEAATDPLVNAWQDSFGQEIADICSENSFELPSGAYAQELYDDHLNACAKADLSPPHAYAITGSATAVNATEATLNGTVNPESLSSQYYFEYGTTKSYGSKTAEVSAGSGIANVAASKVISSLTPGMTYHFRVAEVNSTGTTTGQDHTFTTTVPAWALQTTPNPEGSNLNRMRSISCTSSSYCIAVGDATNKAMSEKWNGTEWSLLSTPSAGTSINEVASVSCASSTACMAVGLYWPTPTTRHTLVESWNGTEWKIQTAPDPAGAKQSVFQGVSCSSATACTAVGYYENSTGKNITLKERWNGTEWKVQESSTEGFLNSVSCASATACMAVGHLVAANTLAESWNGTEWKVVATPAGAATLEGVSCTAANACSAAGSTAAFEKTAAEIWNGTSWTLQTTPNPLGSAHNFFQDVSCNPSTACSAVGWTESTSGVLRGLVERWDGTSWTTQSTPFPAESASSQFWGVSCTSLVVCKLFGWYRPTSTGPRLVLAERYQ
jgi:hypothetical protein